MWSGTITESLILMATLTRFAFALRLNYENPNLCSLAQESRRRLMWAIYILDTFLAGGLPEFTLCPSNVIHLPLPSLEASFELDISYANVPLYDSGPSSTVDDNGLLVYYIRVIYLRDSVLRYGVPQKMISGEEEFE
jgi:Fungal specific transcription factor domain.